MSLNLGDSFPESFRKSAAEKAIKIGSVIRAFSGDIANPKIKRFSIIGLHEEDSI